MSHKPSFLTFTAMPGTLDVLRIFDWYRDNLGFRGDIVPIDPPGYATLRRDAACIKFTHIPTLEKLGLIPEGTTEELRRNWPRFTLTLRVRGIAELQEELTAKGVGFTRREVRAGETARFSVIDADGNTVEFQEA